jgi:hypothetical protein
VPGAVAVSPDVLARQAYSLLPLPDPVPRMAPDRAPDGRFDTIVNLHTWLWVDRTEWRTLTRTTSVPGLAVTVTATPVRTRWDTGEGTVDCGPGTAWSQAALAGETDGFGPASPDCEVRYRRASTRSGLPGNVTATWHVTWIATDGERGELPDLTRLTPFTVIVREYSAVLVE